MRIHRIHAVGIASYIIAFLFLLSIVLKSIFPGEFVRFSLTIMSGEQINVFIGFVMFSEFVIVYLLINESWRLCGLAITVAYLLTGSVWLIILRLNGYDGGCGCFGGLGESSGFSLVRNSVIIVVACIGIGFLVCANKGKDVVR